MLCQFVDLNWGSITLSLHIHIDTVGGLSGDMFIASMLDAFPELHDVILNDLAAAQILEHVSLHSIKTLANGITAQAIEFKPLSDNQRPTHHYSHIKDRLRSSALNRAVLARTIAIFDLLASAEASVHGVAIDDVHFHEIADWDSQADIVSAASIIEHTQAYSWSCSALPMGRGTVQTEHGILPVPAPATAKLLTGFALRDDGESGERVTPTGAAILAHLVTPNSTTLRPTGHLNVCGTGCGKKRFETVPNIARVMVFSINDQTTAATKSDVLTDQVSVISADIDDMTPEELATGIEFLRATAGVIDVSHHVRYGKKGRSMFSLQILCSPAQQEQVVEACFMQTSTIGVRCSLTERVILTRQATSCNIDGDMLPAKQSLRPNGTSTTKIEADALSQYSTWSERRSIARTVEQPAQTQIEAAVQYGVTDE